MASPTVYNDLAHFISAADPAALAEAQRRFEAIGSRFQQLYGTKPEFYVRAPGRVNLIGEHIDYSGYAVLPMAIELDTVVAVGAGTGGSSAHEGGSGAGPRLTVANTLDQQFPARTVENATADVEIDSRRHDWSNYFLAGYKGVLERLRPSTLLTLNCLVDGRVPMGSGLSSSSALVCAAALATAVAYEPQQQPLMSKVDIATLCASSERYIGTQGGGMDQAISFLAQPGKAQLIEFEPLRPFDVTLPDGAVFVIANSLVQANKYYSAYNVRVVECRLAALVLAKRLGLSPPPGIRNLLGLLQKSSGRSLSEMVTTAGEMLHAAPYTVDEVAAIVGSDVDGLRTTYAGPLGSSGVVSLELQRRAVHVFAEALRVYQFRDACAAAAAGASTASDGDAGAGLQRLGQLMGDSHTSCSQLYECSCPELDQLTSICRAAGALGSRLTGAGWGGCTISLVPQARVDEFLSRLQTEYYKAVLDLSPAQVAAQNALFVSRPGNGAAVYRP